MPTVERVTLETAFALWDEIAPRARTRNVFLTPAFLGTWWDRFRRSREERVYIVRDGRGAGARGDRGAAANGSRGEILAIAPFYRETVRTRFGSVRVLRNLGFGDMINPDFLDILCVAGREDDVAGPLADALLADRDWDWAEISELNPEGSFLQIARSWGTGTALSVTEEARCVCPYLALPASFDAYLSSCNPHFRQQLRRYRRVIEREFSPQWKRVGIDISIDEGIALLGALHQERMEATERGGNFRKDDYVAFQRALSERLAQTGDLYFWIVYLEGKPAASHYGFLHDGVYYGYQMGFTPQYAKHSPGHYMTGVTLEKLIAEGAREMNFLRGTDAWKFRWTETTRTTVSLAILPEGLRARSARTAVELSRSPALALRYILGRETFDELRRAWMGFRAPVGR